MAMMISQCTSLPPHLHLQLHLLWKTQKPYGRETHAQTYRWLWRAAARQSCATASGKWSRSAQSDFKAQLNVKICVGILQHYSLAALSLTDNCEFLLLKAKVSLLSEYIRLKAPILPLDNLRSKKKLRGREQEEGMGGWKENGWGGWGCMKNEEREKKVFKMSGRETKEVCEAQRELDRII